MAGMRAVLLFAIWVGAGVFSTDIRANGSVHGSVFAQGTSLGLEGATINLASGCVLGGGYCTYSVNATSAADGSFSFFEVPAGAYAISAYYYPIATGNYLSMSQALNVGDGPATTVTLYMKPGATVSGKVTRSSDNAPVENIGITLQVMSPILDNVAEATTDAAGNYRFSQIKAGDFRLFIAPTAGAPYQTQYYAGHPLTPPSQGPQAADVITLQNGQNLENVDVSLAAGGVIRGTLTDRYTNLPIANSAAITFYLYDPADANGYPWETLETPTDGLGHYELTGLTDSPVILGAFSYVPYYELSIYKCSPDPCADRTVSPVLHAPTGTIIENVNFTLFPGSVIKGAVTSVADGTSIPGATIHAISQLFGGSIVGSTTTDSNGRYTLVGMEPNLHVEVLNAVSGTQAFVSQDYSAHDCMYGVCAPLSSDFVAAPLYKVTTGINFALVPGRAIKGQIRSLGDGQGIQGYVTLFSANGVKGATVTSDAAGFYATSGLQAGNYYLEAYIVNDEGGDCRAYPNTPCASVTSITTQSSPVAVGTLHDRLGVNFFLVSDRLFKDGFEF